MNAFSAPQTPNLNQKTADKLIKVLGLLASNHDGEQLAAANAACEILKNAGLAWTDIIRPRPVNPFTYPDPFSHSVRKPACDMPGWKQQALWGLRHIAFLDEWESKFLMKMVNKRKDPSFNDVLMLNKIISTMKKHGVGQA